MADIQFTVWASAGEVAQGPVLNEGVVTIGAGSLQSGAMDPTAGNRGRRVRLMSDADCWVTWGVNPTALDTGLGGRRLGSENPEYFDIPADQLIAVIERV